MSVVHGFSATTNLPPFVPGAGLEHLRLKELLEAFPGEKLEGRRDSTAEPYVSPSQVKMIHRCLEQYRRRYVLGEKDRPAAALVWGSADHKTFENHYGLQIQTGTGLSVADCRDLFATSLDEQVEADGGVVEVLWDDDRPNLTLADAQKELASIKDRGTALAGAYREFVAPWVRPTAVEERFEIRLEGVPIPIRGAIDLIAEVPKLGFEPVASTTGAAMLEMPLSTRIIDRKTAGRTGMSNEWHLQSRCYQLVVPVPIEFQLSVKNKTPKVVAFDERFTFDPMPPHIIRKQLQRAIALVAHCFEVYGPDEPWPDGVANTWACDYCGFRPTCPWWASS